MFGEDAVLIRYSILGTVAWGYRYTNQWHDDYAEDLAVDAGDLKSSGATRAGSNPALGTLWWETRSQSLHSLRSQSLQSGRPSRRPRGF